MATSTIPLPSSAAHGGFDWPAALAGALIGLALGMLLLAFGAALGLGLASPEPDEGVSARWLTIAGGIWFVWVGITGFGVGGYVAGRLGRAGAADHDEAQVRDGARGLLAWALIALIATAASFSGAGGLADAAGSAVAEVADNEADVAADRLLRDRATGAVPDAASRDIAALLLTRAATGPLDAAERAHLAALAAGSGSAPADAEARVDAALAWADATRQDAETAADTARVTGVLAAFILAATLLAGAAAAYAAGQLGGRQRDEAAPALAPRRATAP